ncbi:alpha/beta hydrolase [Actinomycetota bacterium]
MTDTGHDTTAHALDLRLFPIAGAQVSALVLPGGGFREHTDHDGIGYAHWLNRIGISAAVLHYRLRPDPFPLALQQARAALALLQQSSDDGFCGTSVGVIGSSAGGLLAGLLATGAVLSVEDTPGDVPRPDFQAQCYGLADLGLLPEAAVQALLADRVDLASELSPVSHVDAQTCPSFIWATAADPPGLPNALAWTSTLAEHGVPVELHIYPQGRHGVGLADGVAYGAHDHERIPHTAQWTESFERWVRHICG